MILRECNFANIRGRQILWMQTLVGLQKNAKPSQADILNVLRNELFLQKNLIDGDILDIFLKLTISELFLKIFITTLVLVNQSVYGPNNSRTTKHFHMRHFQRKTQC